MHDVCFHLLFFFVRFFRVGLGYSGLFVGNEFSWREKCALHARSGMKTFIISDAMEHVGRGRQWLWPDDYSMRNVEVFSKEQALFRVINRNSNTSDNP